MTNKECGTIVLIIICLSFIMLRICSCEETCTKIAVDAHMQYTQGCPLQPIINPISMEDK